MRFSEIPAQFNPPPEEKRILQFWDEAQIYSKSLARRRGSPPFVFYEGPPRSGDIILIFAR